MLVVRRFTFEAAHHLPDYDGKCRQVHGHSYTLDVAIGGTIDKETGMVIDFSKIKRAVEPILKEVDHTDLNLIFAIPTAENLAEWFFRKIWMQWEELDLRGFLSSVRLWETPDSFVELARQEIMWKGMR